MNWDCSKKIDNKNFKTLLFNYYNMMITYCRFLYIIKDNFSKIFKKSTN